jgi:hypothetical protein
MSLHESRFAPPVRGLSRLPKHQTPTAIEDGRGRLPKPS